MTAEHLTNPLLVAAVFIAAAFFKFQREELQETFSYLVAAGWFVYLYFNPDIMVDTVRVISRWVLVQIPLVVIFFNVGLWWFGRQYRKALQ